MMTAAAVSSLMPGSKMTSAEVTVVSGAIVALKETGEALLMGCLEQRGHVLRMTVVTTGTLMALQATRQALGQGART